MNRSQILLEIGITPWVLRKQEISSPAAFLANELPPNNSSEITNQTAMPKEQPPIWVLVVEPAFIQSPLLVKITTAIQKFGVQTRLLEFNPQGWRSELVQGDLLIAFGDHAARFFSNEPGNVQDLREIIFETTNHHQQEIPVIITYGIQAMQTKPILKKSLWNDLIFARSVYLEAM